MESDRYVGYEMESKDDVTRTVYFLKGQAIDVTRPQRVEGTLLVIDHPPRVIMGMEFVGFRAFRLVGARVG